MNELYEKLNILNRKEEIDILEVYELRDRFIKESTKSMEQIELLFSDLYTKCIDRLNSDKISFSYLNSLDLKLDDYIDYSEPTRMLISMKKVYFERKLTNLKKLIIENRKLNSYICTYNLFKEYNFEEMTSEEIESAIIEEQTENEALNDIINRINNKSTFTSLAVGAAAGYIGTKLLLKK